VLQAMKSNISFIVGKKVSSYFDGSYITTEKGKVTGIVEKPGMGNEPSDMVGLVFDYFPNIKQFIDLLEPLKSERDDLYELALNLFVKNTSTNVISYEGSWSACKYPWHVLSILDTLLP